jgi:hypothetical protein
MAPCSRLILEGSTLDALELARARCEERETWDCGHGHGIEVSRRRLLLPALAGQGPYDQVLTQKRTGR